MSSLSSSASVFTFFSPPLDLRVNRMYATATADAHRSAPMTDDTDMAIN